MSRIYVNQEQLAENTMLIILKCRIYRIVKSCKSSRTWRKFANRSQIINILCRKYSIIIQTKEETF